MPPVIPNLVSVIIPVFNRPGMLGEAVESVLQQDYRPIEIIIVDDGSTDCTGKLADELASQNQGIIKVIHKVNSGAGASREAGRQIASGEFIQYLDSDDLLLPHKFSKQVNSLRLQPECGASYGWIMLENEDGSRRPEPYKKSGEKRETLFPWILSDRWWNTNTPLWRRELSDQLGAWSDLRWSQDWEYDARAASYGIKLAYVSEFVTIQRQHAGVRQTTAADWMHPNRIRNRLDFFKYLRQHAETAHIPDSDPHRKHFARWVFTWARNAARAGCVPEACELMGLARSAAGQCREARSGFSTFTLAAACLGWKNAARLFYSVEKYKRPGRFTLRESFD